MQPSIVWSSIVSDLLINLSAGWFGAAIIAPNYSEKKGKDKILLLTADLLLGTLCLIVAFYFRSI